MDVTTLVTAAGIFISVVLASVISYRVAAGAAKKSDMETIRDEYKKLQNTYSEENTRLNNAIVAEHNARTAEKLDCQKQIENLQTQLTALLTKLPEPGVPQPVVISGIDTAALPALPVRLTGVAEAVVLPTELIRPIPLPMTAAEKAAAAIEAVKEEVATDVAAQVKEEVAATKDKKL